MKTVVSFLIAGNSSAADSKHIAGELMKCFKTPHSVTDEFAAKLKTIDPVKGKNLARNVV